MNDYLIEVTWAVLSSLNDQLHIKYALKFVTSANCQNLISQADISNLCLPTVLGKELVNQIFA